MEYDKTNITPEAIDSIEGIYLDKRESKIAEKINGKYIRGIWLDYSFREGNERYANINIPAPVGMSIQVALHLDDYDQIDKQLEERLSGIVAEINGAYEYDISACINEIIAGYERGACTKREMHQSMETMLEYATEIDKSKPKCICTDSTRMIAEKLDELQIPNLYWKIGTGVKKNGINHSVIYCFDDKGGWVMLNGKTPANDDTVISKESLENDFVKLY